MSTAVESAIEPAVGREPDFPYEIVDGQIKELPMSAYAVALANDLVVRLSTHGRENGLGQAYSEMLYRLKPGRPQRRPDGAFVSYQRWPKGRRVPSTNAWEVVPDLAVEVISPGEYTEETFEKLFEYLD